MINVSDLDHKRFGKRIAKATITTLYEVGPCLHECRAQDIEMLIARVPTDQLPAVQALEAQGAFITDVLVYYGRSLIRGCETLLEAPSVADGLTLRSVRPEEAPQVREMARLCFTNYYGHYHADPRLDRAAADETYVDWAYRSCLDRKVADDVIVADAGGTLCAFTTLRLNSDAEAEGVLFGVAPQARGKGTYRKLIQQSMAWGLRKHAKHMIYSTQVNNLASQKAWVKEGCAPERSYVTLHYWLSKQHNR